MNRLFLKLALLPVGVWRGMGADTEQLKAILTVKLKMDDRKPLTIGQQKRKKPMKYATALNMFVSLAMGVFYMFPLLVMENRVLSMMLYFSLYMALLSLMLVTDFSNVMFDTRDKFIIFPRPVNDKTIFLSKILHIFIYLFRLVLPMALPAWIILGLKDGWASALLFPLPLLLMTFITLFLVNGCYLLIIRFAGQEKFKEVINYFQIAFTIAIFISAYFLPRVFQSTIFTQPDPASFSWARYLPPYWLGALWSWIGHPEFLAGTKWLAILAIVFPVALVWINVKWLAPRFAQKIGGMDAAEPVAGTLSTNKKQANSTFYKKLALMLNRNAIAQAGFMLTWLQTARSRNFKMRVYPMVAYAPVFFVYTMFVNNNSSFAETWAGLPDTKSYLGLLYICSLTVMQAINYLTYSDQYKAAWVYYASPVEKPGQVMIGAFKALWVKYFMPFFIFITIFILWVWGPGVIVDIILAVTNMAVFSMVLLRVSYRNFPFSVMEQMQQSGNRIIKSILSLAIPGILATGHFFAPMLWLKLLLLALSGLLLWLVWDSYANTSWQDMRKADVD